jgi:3D (Asp-Asp-Asp) domain-containing protein
MASEIGYLNLMNVTDPANPYLYEELYLSWSPEYTDFPPLNVPDAGGEPYRVEVLGTYAYVVNVGLGIQAVDLTKVIPPQTEAQRDAIVGTITEPSYRGISKIDHSEDPSKSFILATKNHTLSIIDPGLNIISEVADLHLPYEVTGVTAFPLDVDGDGNLGTDEDNDGDSVTSQQETFDLAFVSTSDGVVIVDVTNPQSPVKIAVIPTNGILPGKVVVNRAKRLAYTTVGSDFWAISLKSFKELQGSQLVDVNADGRDDRVVSVIKRDDTNNINYGFSDGVVEMDAFSRELLYEITGGVVTVLDLNLPRIDARVMKYEYYQVKKSGMIARRNLRSDTTTADVEGFDTQFTGKATGYTAGGMCNYIYNWDFGDQSTCPEQSDQNAKHIYKKTRSNYPAQLDVQCNGVVPFQKAPILNVKIGFYVTCYITALESEYGGSLDTQPNLHGVMYKKKFLEEVRMQGSGTASNGDNIQYDPDTNTWNKVAQITIHGKPIDQNVVAADRRIIPMGTVIEIETVGKKTASDTGSRILGPHIDLWLGPGNAACNAFRAKGNVYPVTGY